VITHGLLLYGKELAKGRWLAAAAAVAGAQAREMWMTATKAGSTTSVVRWVKQPLCPAAAEVSAGVSARTQSVHPLPRG
jgi:hypothetical protein